MPRRNYQSRRGQAYRPSSACLPNSEAFGDLPANAPASRAGLRMARCGEQPETSAFLQDVEEEAADGRGRTDADG